MEDKNQDYININKRAWNNRVDAHVISEFYDVDGFKAGNTSLREIEIAILGNVQGKSILHLQCHFGQDTISLARMGAIAVGVDFSDKAIAYARTLNKETNTSAKFICCDIYELPQVIDTQFDIVFTSYGTIGWLPDIEKWASVVAAFLKPGGKFIFVEFHPVVWMFDNDFANVQYSYFNTDTIIETETGSYADKDATMISKTVSWNHPISEVVNNLIGQGLQINSLLEYDFAPYNCFRHMEQIAPHRFRIKHLESKIPMVYSLVAAKPEVKI